MNAITFYYQKIDSEIKPWVVYLHGFMGSASDWQPLMNTLNNDYRHLAIDLPGHGRTDLPNDGIENLNFEQVADQLLLLLDQNGIERSHLIAYSMGGRLALYLLLRYPQRWHRAVIESASPGIEDETERSQRYERDKALADQLADIDFEQFLNHWYSQPLFSGIKKRSDFKDLLIARMNNQREHLAQALRGLSVGRQPSLWSLLSGVTTPTLLIHGEWDEKYSVIVNRMANHSNNFYKKMIPACGHNCHFEKPEKFNAIVKSFLQHGEV